MGPGGAGRRNSAVDIGVKPTHAIPIEKIETQEKGDIGEAPNLTASQPVTVARQTLAPLAPLQCTTLYEKRNIAQYLTFVEAVSLMLASTDMHQAIQGDLVLRLDEISASLRRLGFDPLLVDIKSLDAEIAELQRQLGPGATVVATPADTARKGFSLARLSLQFRRSAKQPKETPAQAELREKTTQKDQLATLMEAHEPDIQDVLLHFADERLKGPRALTAAAQVYVPRGKITFRLLDAIGKGDVALVRACVREFLSLPERTMPAANKLSWLHGTLSFLARLRCEDLASSELWRYEATIAYVDEIISSPYLADEDKRSFCHQLQTLARNGRTFERDIFGYALFHDSPVVAAAILLGIHESCANPELKQSLLAGISASWGGIGPCVDCVSGFLEPFKGRAPQWIPGFMEALERMKPVPAKPAETKE